MRAPTTRQRRHEDAGTAVTPKFHSFEWHPGEATDRGWRTNVAPDYDKKETAAIGVQCGDQVLGHWLE